VIDDLAFSLLKFYLRVLWRVQLFDNFLYYGLPKRLHYHILLILFWGLFLLQFPLLQLFQKVKLPFHPPNEASTIHYYKHHGITILLDYLLSEFPYQLVPYFLSQIIPLLLPPGFYCVLQSILPYVTNLWPFLVGLKYFHYLNYLLLIWLQYPCSPYTIELWHYLRWYW